MINDTIYFINIGSYLKSVLIRSHSAIELKRKKITVTDFLLVLLHLAVKDNPTIKKPSYQNQSDKLNHISASEVCRAPHGRVAAVSVPLVNNRKGSLLPPSEPSALRLSLMGSRELGQVARAPGMAEEASRLQRARSLPVKYRYHPSHSSNAILNHRHCKPPRPPLLCVTGLCSTPRPSSACVCEVGVVACVAFLTNDPVCAAVSCETLNIEQAEEDVKDQCVVGASLSNESTPPPPPTSTFSITVSHGVDMLAAGLKL